MSGRALAARCRALDGQGYGAYRSLGGAWELGEGIALFVDRVAPDPFAPPTRIRLRVAADAARVPESLTDSRVRRIALADWLARRTAQASGGAVSVDSGGQAVLERSAIAFPDGVEARLQVKLPARRRRIRGGEAARLLTGTLPEIARRALQFPNLDLEAAERFVADVELQEGLRAELGRRGLVAFVGDGAILPRAHGASDRPMPPEEAAPFRSPASLQVELPLPGGGTVAGMGVPAGLTVIAGGGFHGKSTLLQALAHGVAPHVPGDGRERVVTRADAVAVQAEEGRPIQGVDLRPFLGALPGSRPAARFRTADASGSTSQAASILEALEAGSRLLLLDEDSSATNLLVRDARMQALVARENEPITPLLDRIGWWREAGVSVVLVTGGSGDFLDAADAVIRMTRFQAEDATAEARRIARAIPARRASEPPDDPPPSRPRTPLRLDPAGRRGRPRIRAARSDELLYGEETVRLGGVRQILDPSQTRAIGRALALADARFMGRTVPEALDEIEGTLDADGLDALAPAGRRGEHPGRLARPRRFEIAAAMNRLRTARFTEDEP